MSLFVDANTVKGDALEWTRFLLVVVVWLSGSDADGALLLSEHVLGVDVRLWR